MPQTFAGVGWGRDLNEYRGVDLLPRVQVQHAAGAPQTELHPPPQRWNSPPAGVDLFEQVRHGASRQELGDDHVRLLLGARPQELHRVRVVDLLEHVQLGPASKGANFGTSSSEVEPLRCRGF
jgi:hypothetical protein